MDGRLLRSFVLAATSDQTGRTLGAFRLGLAGAALVSLERAGCVTLQDGRVAPVPGARFPADRALQVALVALRAERRPSLARAIGRLDDAAGPIARHVRAALVADGSLVPRRRRRFLVIPTTAYLPGPAQAEALLRRRVRVGLAHDALGQEDQALVALLAASEAHEELLGPGRAVGRLARRLVRRHAVAQAVADAVAAATVAAAMVGVSTTVAAGH